MNIEAFDMIIFITGIALGCAISFVIKHITSKNTGKLSKMSSNEASVQSLQQELEKKQVIIDNFFADSNAQLDITEKRLLELRKSFHNGAKQLSNITIENSLHIEKFEQPVPLTDEQTEPPRDYALKNSDDTGMLSETFGFDKKIEDIEPKRTI